MKVSHKVDTRKAHIDQGTKVLADSRTSVKQISDRAYHEWLKRGCTHGFDVEDWLEAENQILSQEPLIADNSDGLG